jgi:hypothetical protein
MIGASKLNKEDALAIRRLVAKGHNDAQIAREFVSHNGSTISRIHVRDIRIGKKWNMDKHGFIMKDDLQDLPYLKTEVNGDVFETELGFLVTATKKKWFFLTLLNFQEVDGPPTSLLDRKPSKGEILAFHNSFVSHYL